MIVEMERRDRETGIWEPCSDTQKTLHRLEEYYNDKDLMIKSLEAGEILTTGFADYRKSLT